MEPIQIAVLAVVLFLGLCIGSFLNVCIYRIPLKISVAGGRSYCPDCRQKIVWYDNIPLVSFLILKGRCRHCRKNISPVYPIVEALTGILFLLSFWKFGLGWKFASSVVLISGLIVVFFIDLKYQIIPDAVSLPGILAGVVFSLFIPGFTWWQSLLGVLIGGGVLYFLATAGQFLFKKESLGGGDIKLAAMLGAFLGWEKVILVFFISSLLGAVVGGLLMLFIKSFRNKRIIPFGPFLALASVVALFVGDKIIYLYLSSVGL